MYIHTNIHLFMQEVSIKIKYVGYFLDIALNILSNNALFFVENAIFAKKRT